MSSPRLTGKISVKRPFIDYVTIIESAPFLKKSWGEWSCSLWKTVVKKRDRETNSKIYNFTKKETQPQLFFCGFFEIFKKTLFIRILPVAASEAPILEYTREKLLLTGSLQYLFQFLHKNIKYQTFFFK